MNRFGILLLVFLFNTGVVWADFPAKLSELGIFNHLPDWKQVDPSAHFYSPMWELWSQGESKFRYIVLPKGTSIDNTGSDTWGFPSGTMVVKTFAYRARESVDIPLETRLLKYDGAAWDYAVYRWKDDQSDADRLDLSSRVEIPVTLSSGIRLTHVIPNRFDCVSCHAANTSGVIGFNELQLNSRLEGHELVQYRELNSLKLFERPLPQQLRFISGRTEKERSVKGYVQGNCVHCHHANSDHIDLSDGVFLSNTVNHPAWESAGILVVPGDPENSVLWRLMSGGRMPPLGLQPTNPVALDEIRQWIKELAKPKR